MCHEIVHVTVTPNARSSQKGRHVGMRQGPVPFIGQRKGVHGHADRADGTHGEERLHELDGVAHDEPDPAPTR